MEQMSVPDDPRDKYVPKHPTPPSGVRKPTHKPESWEGADSYTDLGRSDPKTPPKTPVGGVAIPRTISDSEMLQHVARRTGETKNLAIDTKRTTVATLDRVEELRKEMREDVNSVNEKVDTAIMVIGELREDVGEQRGINKLILSHLEEAKQHRENEQRVITRTRLAESEVETTRQITQLELDKAKGLDSIEAAKERRRHVWALVWKVVAGIGAIWAVVSVGVISRCGG